MRQRRVVLFWTGLILILCQVGTGFSGLNDGLVAYWSFNNCDNTDDSGNGHLGTSIGGPKCVDGAIGKGFEFDGTNDIIGIPDHPAFHFTNGMSVSAWVKAYDISNLKTIICKAYAPDSFWLIIEYGMYIFRAVFAGDGWIDTQEVSFPAVANTWTHVAGIFNGQDIFLYINGQLAMSKKVNGLLQDTDRPIAIGNHPSWNAFKGIIDEVRLYNRPLTASEIQQLYQKTTNKSPVVNSFTANPTTGPVPLLVALHCDAMDPDGTVAQYIWELGDGSTQSTTSGNTTHLYHAAGAYKARVTVVDNGGEAAISDPVTITVSSTYSISGHVKTGSGSPVPDVTMNLSGAASRTTATGSDGNYGFSELQNGVYKVIPSKEQYTFNPANRSINVIGADVTAMNFTGTLLGLTVTSPNGSESWPLGSSQTIRWAYSGDVGGNVRLDLLKGGLLAGTIIPSTPVGASGSGSHAWLIPSNVPSGTDYQIGITSISNSSYKDTSDNAFTIASATPVAAFSATPSTGDAPLTVQLTDQSTGEITARTWDFGDWTTSIEQHPVHTYTNPGSYGVTLNVTGPGGSDFEVKSNYIIVKQPSTQYTLTTTKNGTGTGKVTSFPEGIDCGADCGEPFNANTSVTLTAAPDRDSLFSGWSGGGCSGKGPCTVKVSDDKTVTARFDKRSSDSADLVMTVVSAPSSGTAGQTIQVLNTVKNQGKIAAGPLTIGIYLSHDRVINPATDVLLGSRDRQSLQPGEISTAAVAARIPGSTGVGSYFIGALADIRGVVDESNESNNSKLSAKKIKIISPLPDLTVTDVSGPVTAARGESIQVLDGIKNVGKSDAKAGFTIYLLLSRDTTINMKKDAYLGNHGLSGLNVGQSVRKTTHVTIPSEIEPGTYYLGAWVDAEDAILESNEYNNTKPSLATIQVVE